MAPETVQAKVVDLTPKLADKKKQHERELYRRILASVKHIGEPLPTKATNQKAPS